MNNFEHMQLVLRKAPRTWLVTGCAGFIGSNLTEFLLKLDQTVIGLDNFATGHQHNLDDVRGLVSARQWERFRFLRGDIRRMEDCRAAVQGAEVVLHQAALGSVPRSLEDPVTTNAANVDGFLNMLVAARDAGVRSFVYAASSSTYGDHPALPKVEARIGRPLSPYAVTKYVNELYADVFARGYGFGSTGLRYFNVFGRRQDPNGAYAAVIPKWIAAMLADRQVSINGDGSTSRDFCFVENVIQANLLAAMAPFGGRGEVRSEVYNVAVGDATTLNQLYAWLKEILQANGVAVTQAPAYAGFRNGDVRHSQADIGKAMRELGYQPTHRIDAGLRAVIPWYIAQSRAGAGGPGRPVQERAGAPGMQQGLPPEWP